MRTFFTRQLYKSRIAAALCCLIVSTSSVLVPAELMVTSVLRETIATHGATAYQEHMQLAPLINNIVLTPQPLSRCGYTLAVVFIMLSIMAVPLAIHEIVMESHEELLELAGVRRPKFVEEFGRKVGCQ